MTLTWNFRNELGWPNIIRIEGDEAYFEPDTEHGLTETGIEFVREMERLGMIMDVSHLSDAGIMDVFRYTKKPFVASHSNARTVASNPRNLTDEAYEEDRRNSVYRAGIGFRRNRRGTGDKIPGRLAGAGAGHEKGRLYGGGDRGRVL